MSKTYVPSALRQTIYQRASGCCEYCLLPEMFVLASHEIDHIIAEKHGGLTNAENLALSCVLCNKLKGSDIASVDPETGNIVPLYNPRQARWLDHFQLSDGQIIPLTPVGRVTIRLLQMNRPDRVEERQLVIEAGMFNIPS
jgi:HNH endonuclease